MEKKNEVKKPYGYFCIHTNNINLSLIPVPDKDSMASMACSICDILPKLWQICTCFKELTLTFTPESADVAEIESKDIITFNR